MLRHDRDPDDPEAATSRLTVQPVRPSINEAKLSAAAGVVAVLLVIAVVKPWGTGSSEPSFVPRPATPGPVVVTPVPTEDRTAEGLAQPICLGSGAWRVTSVETWQTQDVRVWRAIEPVATATGPLDPSIPSVPIVALELQALGWCAPAFGPDKPAGPAAVTAWSVVHGVASELSLQQLRPTDGVTPIAALYIPLTWCPEPTICAPLLPQPKPRPWTSGRVVFRYRNDATSSLAWFAADIAIVTLPSPAPTPSL